MTARNSATDLSPPIAIECALTEISEALSVIQLLVPETRADAEGREWETMQAIGYVVFTMRNHVSEIEAALEKLKHDKPAEARKGGES